MKKARKSTFFIVAVLILIFTGLTITGFRTYYGDNENVYVKGISDIRWGIDIQGGVEAVFTPDIAADKITSQQMDDAETILKVRLTNKNITDYELYKDTQHKQLIVRFPWQSGTSDFDPEKAVSELGQTAVLTFCEGSENNETVILTGSKDVESARAGYDEQNGYVVQLKLTNSGKTKFASATARLQNQTISIWMDDTMISAPTVNAVINNGEAIITGNFDVDSAKELADTINAGSLPFGLTVDNSKLNIVNPTLGQSSLEVMLIAGLIAFALIIIIMISLYRVPGIVATFALTCQMAGIFACISGFLPFFESFTLTIPGIAGIILSIGMGVDANVINSERVIDELYEGKTIDGAINTGYKRGFGAILDGNVTVIIVSVVLMGAFGPPSMIWAKVLNVLGMFLFSSSITGTIYSFGYTLLIGAIFNLLIGVFLSKIMIRSISQLKPLRKPQLFGGAKDAK
ncbi:MAG: protein translocase subunit SecD [Acutalibacteraceae bacterium]|nr:protein translocase subunit SecD [Acutalibacteraceae bacterium]